MKLSADEVRQVARLARLALRPDEVERYRAQLSAILDAVDLLSALDASGVPPTSSALDEVGPLRPDEARPPLSQEEALANAPERRDGSFALPKVLE